MNDPRWRLCKVCNSTHIPSDWNPAWCSACGGPRVNCQTCGTGRRWWIGHKPPYRCQNCGKNPLEAVKVIEKPDDGFHHLLSPSKQSGRDSRFAIVSVIAVLLLVGCAFAGILAVTVKVNG